MIFQEIDHALMSSGFAGINSKKIDELVAAIVELRTTLRICLAVIGLGFPMMVGLLTFLVAQSFSTAAKVDRLSDRVDRLSDQVAEVKSDIAEVKSDIADVRSDRSRLAERLERLERAAR